ncbi:Dos2-interacting transcription regulator of RNA-Pol-II family protein [Leishmania donovani]|uniref:MMS19 nucleotide excision repair protein n=2 Tax=Leishmania donovani TaxID=5661 RepID=A0A504XC52_LEIDO|nr:Dos2-interacting transcription regulator of RNA-Pol-II family protein [Leishmania donovani]
MSIEEHIAAAIAADGAATDALKEALRSHSLLSICKAMREHLCTPEKVQPAMRLLASVAAGRAGLSRTDIRLLFVFFAEKLAQQELQTTALSSLALLISYIREQHECDEEWFKIVGTPFTEYVRVQQLPLHSRKQCFCIMSFLFTEKTMDLCDGNILAALLELIDGESDPELVLLTFDLHVVAATRSTREAFATVVDDYFESVSSYFPVVFSQPPGCKVTKTDLRTGLKRCLCLAVYKELCIPFMQSKLTSPSTSVKEDVLDVLLTCFDTYSSQDLVPHCRSLVLHMKSEVIKLSSFADRASNATLTKCLLMSCEVLGRVSKQCSAKTQSEALEIFGPVVEGVLAALSADPPTCSAYGTMVVHVLTGSWNCCLFVASYLFSMLAMSIEGAERPANAFILLAALASGMLDGLDAFPGETHKEQLRTSIERTTPMVVETVTGCSQRWRAAGDETCIDDFTLMCGCEFLVCVLKLSAAIEPWMPAATASEGVDALVWVALHHTAEVSAKVCRLLREYAAVDALQVQEALSRLLCNPSAPPEQALNIACELARTSLAALLLVFGDGFFSTTCEWIRGMAAGQRAAALQKALQHFGRALQDGAADRMTALLGRDDVSPEFFECACLVASNLSGDTCGQQLSTEGALSLLGIAAVVSGRTHLHCVLYNWANTAAQFVGLTTSDHQAWRRVGMEGITGMLMNKVFPEDTQALLTRVSRGHLNVGVAILWGKLLADRADGGEAAAPPPGELVSSFLYQHLGVATSASCCDRAAVQEAFSYVPFLATQVGGRPSLLQLLLGSEMSHSERPNHALCSALHCLVDKETEERVQACLVDLLAMVRKLTSSGADNERALARALLFSVDAKCGGSVALARSVLFNDSSVQALLEGTKDASLTVRCRSLHLIRSLARGALLLMGNCSQEEKAELARARDHILLVTKRSLGDHKRRVRQASVACRHEWFKVK